MPKRWQHSSPSSARQPALSSDGAAQPSSLPRSAEQPSFTQMSNDTSELTVGFYNVGIQLTEVGGKTWKKKEEALMQDIVKALLLHDLHMLCLSELGEIHKGLGSKLQTTVKQWILDLLEDSVAQPVSIYADAHYVTIVKKEDVVVAKYTFIAGFIPEQAYRSFQDFQVHLCGDNKLQ